ncbi:hypothetical protein [Demequina subtropica]|uniref:hypothetical protein n=1 Tax=Demequina subtropica TaxID=1638989 RepID=UPI0007824B3B|nr:hypothetical protein [Demequina subtropica]
MTASTHSTGGGVSPSQRRIGHDDLAGRDLALADAQASRVRLESPRSVLPEVVEIQIAPRRWYRHPAFLVSLGLTMVALAAMVVLLVLDARGGDEVPVVTGLTIEEGEGSVTLAWSGATDGAFLYSIDPGAEAPADLSQLVRGATAWLPLSADLYTPRTCFVVVPATLGESGEVLVPTSVPATAVEREATGAATVCVSDAGA